MPTEILAVDQSGDAPPPFDGRRSADPPPAAPGRRSICSGWTAAGLGVRRRRARAGGARHRAVATAPSAACSPRRASPSSMPAPAGACTPGLEIFGRGAEPARSPVRRSLRLSGARPPGHGRCAGCCPPVTSRSRTRRGPGRRRAAPVVRDVSLDVAPRRVRRHPRPERLGQDHAAQAAGGRAGADRPVTVTLDGQPRGVDGRGARWRSASRWSRRSSHPAFDYTRARDGADGPLPASGRVRGRRPGRHRDRARGAGGDRHCGVRGPPVLDAERRREAARRHRGRRWRSRPTCCCSTSRRRRSIPGYQLEIARAAAPLQSRSAASTWCWPRTTSTLRRRCATTLVMLRDGDDRRQRRHRRRADGPKPSRALYGIRADVRFHDARGPPDRRPARTEARMNATDQAVAGSRVVAAAAPRIRSRIATVSIAAFAVAASSIVLAPLVGSTSHQPRARVRLVACRGPPTSTRRSSSSRGCRACWPRRWSAARWPRRASSSRRCSATRWRRRSRWASRRAPRSARCWCSPSAARWRGAAWATVPLASFLGALARGGRRVPAGRRHGIAASRPTCCCWPASRSTRSSPR